MLRSQSWNGLLGGQGENSSTQAGWGPEEAEPWQETLAMCGYYFLAGPWTRRGPRNTQARPPTEVTARALRPVPRPHSRAATASRNTVSLSKRHRKRIASVPVSGRLASGRECEGVRACRWLVSGGACVGVPVCGCACVRRCVCGCAGVQVGTQAQEEGHELPSAKKCRPKSHCVR